MLQPQTYNTVVPTQLMQHNLAVSAAFFFFVDKYMRRTAMGFERRKKERRALVQHLLAQDWNVFGTLKFVNGRTIGRETAKKLLRSYWNKIDRVIYGKAAERQDMRLPRWCFAHEGADSENFHVHFVLKAATPDTEHMCCLLNAV